MNLFTFDHYILFFLLGSFFISLSLSYLFIREKLIPNRYSIDFNEGTQKIHDGKIKRIGGLPIVISFISVFIINEFTINNKINFNLISILFFSIIIFIIGFIEDLIKDIKPTKRLLTLFISTCCWLFFSENLIQNTNIDFVDNVIEIKIFAVILTLTCMIATLNATNMMDGANGLLTIFGITVSLVMLCYAYRSNDLSLITVLIVLIGSLLGFLVFNWPKGFIFLGDGGSYFIGVILSTVLIYMSNNLNNFNMLNALVIMIYPIWELVFTVFRRVYISSKITHPDNLHLHTIINANIKRLDFIKNNNIDSNPLTGIIINLIALLPSITFLIYKFDDNLEDLESIYFFTILFSIYTIVYLFLRKINDN